MRRGVSFEIPQITTDILGQILECINVEKFCWYNVESQSEVWSENQEEDFFDANYYDGKEFFSHIHDKHYIVFLKLQAYFIDDEFNEIHSYEEFLQDNCQIIVLINDCEFVELYLKNQKEISEIYKNAIKKEFKNIEYITEKNDGRIRMDVV